MRKRPEKREAIHLRNEKPTDIIPKENWLCRLDDLLKKLPVASAQTEGPMPFIGLQARLPPRQEYFLQLINLPAYSYTALWPHSQGRPHHFIPN